MSVYYIYLEVQFKLSNSHERRSILKFLPPYGPMLRKTKMKINAKAFMHKNGVGSMVDNYFSTKFCIKYV